MIQITLIFIIALLIIATVICSFFYVTEYTTRKKTEISFRSSIDLTELPIITFHVKNKKLNFLLDTGSNLNHINASVLKDVEHEALDAKVDISGIEGEKQYWQLCILQLSYKDTIFEDIFTIANLDKAFGNIKQDHGVTVHGILGNSFFTKYKYVLDYKTLSAYRK